MNTFLQENFYVYVFKSSGSSSMRSEMEGEANAEASSLCAEETNSPHQSRQENRNWRKIILTPEKR